MQQTMLVGTGIALGSGLAIGLQAILFTVIGRAIGPLHASLILNVTGGVVAGVVLLAAIGLQGWAQWGDTPRSTLVSAVVAVSMGIAIVMGVAFSMQKVGAAAGVATLFLGQMLIGVIADMMGWTGKEPIPLDLHRVLGLLVLALAITLLVRQT